MKHKFYGGVHPAEHKEATEQKPITELVNAPAQVVIPMSMHIGAPCKPIVAKGDAVTVGQLIGETAGMGAPIHASVSGVVTAVEPRPGSGGNPVLSVVIENDFQNTLSPDCKPRENTDALTAEEIIGIIRDGGVTGMGGAGFPTHVKISSAVGKADTIIINGAECEPYITADHRLMLEHGEKIIGGVQFIMRALKLDHAYIGVEDNKLNAITHLKSLAGDKITVEALHTRYPQGAEKQLIQRITGREIPPGKLPADVGCCVFNVATTAAVYDAVALGHPVTQRVVTVTGSAVKNPVNLRAPFGTPFSHLIEEAGGFNGTPARVISGGPMMGAAQYDLSVSMGKATNCVLCLDKKDLPAQNPELTCIRCARCVNVCPMHLTPVYMNLYARKRQWTETENLRIMDCMECGSCQYICPARIPLVQQFRSAKFEIRQLSAKK
ncbi:MAG: electron transport complex subunit RsxC [Evtepia sp.]